MVLVCLALAAGVFSVSARETSDGTILVNGTFDPDGKTVWYDAQHLGIEGQGWKDTESSYDRLPRKAKGVVRSQVWKYSRCSAGLSVRFNTDSHIIRVRWTLAHENTEFSHLADLGVNGIDLYYRSEKTGKFRNCPGDFGTIYPSGIVNTAIFRLPKSREYELNLPAYNGVKRVEIGVPKGKTLLNLPARNPEESIVFYGTSITQGAHVHRPGMTATTMVRRKLDVPVINLGICGNGMMDIEMAELMSELDPALYVVDCLWNMHPELVAERAAPFVRRIRQERPTTPIVLVEDSHYDDRPTQMGSVLREVVAKLTAEGDQNLYFLSNKGMLGEDGDGVADDRHPNDLGMFRQAEVFIKFLKPILDRSRRIDAREASPAVTAIK